MQGQGRWTTTCGCK